MRSKTNDTPKPVVIDEKIATKQMQILKIYALFNLASNLLPTIVSIVSDAIHGSLKAPVNQTGKTNSLSEHTYLTTLVILFIVLALVEILWIRADIILYKGPTIRRARFILKWFTALTAIGVFGSLFPKILWFYLPLNLVLLAFTVYLLFKIVPNKT